MTEKQLIVPILTPRKDGELDIPSLAKLTHFLVDSNVTGIFVLGTTGEFQFLSLEEKIQVSRTVSKATDGNMPLYLGISADSLKETKKLIELAHELQVAAVVYTPQYGEGTIEEKNEIVLTMSELPIILYNNPHITGGVNASITLIEELAQNEKIIGVKDSSGDMDYFNSLLEMKNENFFVLVGEERIALQALSSGAHGIVSGSSNVYPEVFTQFVQEPHAENFEKIRDVHTKMESRDPNYMKAMKMKLKEMDIIASDEMWS